MAVLVEGTNQLNVQMIPLEPVGWISPTGHIDASSEWITPENAYDGDVVTSTYIQIGSRAWSPYLELLVNEAYINKLRFDANYLDIARLPIDLDVYYNGAWHDVYSGAFAHHVWVEKPILAGTQLVSKARIRFYRPPEEGRWIIFFEFQFNKIA